MTTTRQWLQEQQFFFADVLGPDANGEQLEALGIEPTGFALLAEVTAPLLQRFIDSSWTHGLAARVSLFSTPVETTFAVLTLEVQGQQVRIVGDLADQRFRGAMDAWLREARMTIVLMHEGRFARLQTPFDEVRYPGLRKALASAPAAAGPWSLPALAAAAAQMRHPEAIEAALAPRVADVCVASVLADDAVIDPSTLWLLGQQDTVH